MKVGLQVAAGTALGLLMGATPVAAAEDDAAMLCAVTQLFECLDGSACRQISADAVAYVGFGACLPIP